ncbi:hypothetical protein IEQ34_008881 [Dendrobium chrysotoxum]|uniref:non-specific serine/threonine protein kinase n=1 Tax=Dendrobium chrysotoxum TaxID=161865 RepID=A0AAV7GX72_DENCH|nr:hypothetical protein IEQ34_008881 [Dendrobium chrysotoxum]
MAEKICIYALPTLFCLVSFLLHACASKTLNPEPELATLSSPPLISFNTTILSPNRTFELGFFSVDGGSTYYLGIWYASIPIRTYVWVANRLAPVRASPPSALLTIAGRLAVADSSNSILWETENSTPAAAVQLLDTGNLVLLSVGGRGAIAWQSFDFPADTWLPEMAVTGSMAITSWRSPMDPSPGEFSLRLRPPKFGEFELVFNGSVSYWWTGNWTGTRFTGVPEMTVPYIYSFRFSNPFTPEAAFDYSQSTSAESGLKPLLSRFVVDSSGQLMQYTWSPQADSWNMFWSRPDDPCRVYGRCGGLGLCSSGRSLRPCTCPMGLRPVDPDGWSSGDFSRGCSRDALCTDEDSIFNEIGHIELDSAVDATFSGVSRGSCEDSCRKNCSCFGITYNSESRICTNLYVSAYNLRNSTASATLFIRISPGKVLSEKSKWKVRTLIIGIICALVANIAIAFPLVIIVQRRLRRLTRREEYGGEDVGLKIFTYKELSSATRGFSEKLGHGGFGAVFRGSLPDSTPVAVKRLERPGGGGDREFCAEVRTIGSVQHVNLVRLRGFCIEDPHRLLVYDYMPNGPLSAYLGRGSKRPRLSWPASFRVAVGTARGVAYLHEECHDCIIHCDIKPENILLDADFTPRVSDFGLAKLVGRDLSRVLATTRGTRGYVAPEWISGVAITAKADVYSYGMTLMEIIGGRRNVEAPSPQAVAGDELGEEGWFFPAWAARKIVEGDWGAVLEEEVEGYDGMEAERAARVAVWCIQDEEAARPTMGTVVKMLEGTVVVAAPPLPKMMQALIAGESFRHGSSFSAGEILVEDGPGTAGDPGRKSQVMPTPGSPFGRGNPSTGGSRAPNDRDPSRTPLYSVNPSADDKSSSASRNPFAVAARFVGSCFAPTMGRSTNEIFSDGFKSGSQTSASGSNNGSFQGKVRRLSASGIYSSSSQSEPGGMRFTMAEINKATKNFSPSLKVGQGGFGTVYKGKLDDGMLVATMHDKQLGTEFQSEVQTLARVEHLNLVRFLGYLEFDNERILVVEYVPNGTLREHLDCLHGDCLNLVARLDVAIDVAHAVTYLHMYADHPIIHRDIKSSNILLTENFRAKVADFGFARLGATEIDATHVSTQVKGTAGYLDPEYLKTYQLTEKSDVYSFGVLLVELISGRRPIEPKRDVKERLTPRWAMKKFMDGDAIQVLDPNLPQTPAATLALEKILELSLQCLAPTRQSRPSMRMCAEILWSIRKDFRELWSSDELSQTSQVKSSLEMPMPVKINMFIENRGYLFVFFFKFLNERVKKYYRESMKTL